MEELEVGFSERGKDETKVGSSSLEILDKEKLVQLELSEKVVPKAGMVLGSEEEVYNLYVEHARQEGFGITKKSTYVMNCYDDTQTSERKVKYNKLCSHFSKAAEFGAESMEKYNFLMKCVDGAIEKLMDNGNFWGNHSNEVLPMMLEENNEQHQTTTTTKFLTPLKVRSKGRPTSKRKKSKVEEIIIRNKKRKAQTKGNSTTQNDTQVELCTQESVVNSNSLSNKMNMQPGSSLGFTSPGNETSSHLQLNASMNHDSMGNDNLSIYLAKQGADESGA